MCVYYNYVLVYCDREVLPCTFINKSLFALSPPRPRYDIKRAYLIINQRKIIETLYVGVGTLQKELVRHTFSA